ncbi:MAG: glutamate 5-kinase [Deltaproteobacteria bacterium]|nr:glutamate 5-kinase [Candidatus Zymogenaceae bacterium]
MTEETNIRESHTADVGRVVVKIGSGVLTARHGLNIDALEGIVSDIASLCKRGIECIVVSSGAIAAGLPRMGITVRPRAISMLQAAASVGQTSLMRAYERAFDRHDIVVGQILLTHEDLKNRHRFINARNTILALIDQGIIPIINENDTVAVSEIRLGDNDYLASQTINLAGADLLILLTDTDGFFDKDPHLYSDASLISVVHSIIDEIKHLASDTSTAVGRGGMKSKVEAADMATAIGIPAIIANGLTNGILLDILEGKNVGTLFIPRSEGLNSRKHWIAYTLRAKGSLTVDQGAADAIADGGKSLLPKGIVSLSGSFSPGDLLSIMDPQGREFARGLVNYNSKEISRIKGLNSGEIEATLGYKYSDEIIHRDNLVLMNGR